MTEELKKTHEVYKGGKIVPDDWSYIADEDLCRKKASLSSRWSVF